jgi:hypothetical protein
MPMTATQQEPVQGGSLQRVVPRARLHEMGLTDREREILDLERTWWQETGAKADMVRERFGLSSTRYYQLLNELLDAPAAMAYDPLTVRRLRRLRVQRRRARFEGRPAGGERGR